LAANLTLRWLKGQLRAPPHRKRADARAGEVWRDKPGFLR